MIEITNDLVTVVAAQIPEMNEEQVSQVLAALNSVYEGPPVGTIITNPETGAVGHRVSENGVILWKITEANGGTWGSHEPTLPGWTVLHQPTTP